MHPTFYDKIQERFPLDRKWNNSPVNHGLKSGIVPFSGPGGPTVKV
jgi:hypothetical protein